VLCCINRWHPCYHAIPAIKPINLYVVRSIFSDVATEVGVEGVTMATMANIEVEAVRGWVEVSTLMRP